MNSFSKLAVVLISTVFLSGGYAFAACDDVAVTTDPADQLPLAPADQPPENHEAVAPQKDGTNVPLGESYDLAMSGNDVVAQNDHQPTATEKGQDHMEKCVLEDTGE